MKKMRIELAVFVALTLSGCQSIIPGNLAGTYYYDTSHLCSHADQITLVLTKDGRAHESGYAPGVYFDDGQPFEWECDGIWTQNGSVVTLTLPDAKPEVLKAEICKSGRYKGRLALAVYPYEPKLSSELQTRYVRAKDEENQATPAKDLASD